MTDLENLLKGARINEAHPVHIKKRTELLNAGIGIEETEHGFALHFDILLSDSTAERVSIPFDLAGWARFKNMVNAAGSGIDLPQSPANLKGLH